jgi:hypothetical protein
LQSILANEKIPIECLIAALVTAMPLPGSKKRSTIKTRLVTW